MFNSGSIGFNCFLVELHLCSMCVLLAFSPGSIWSLFGFYLEFMLGFMWVLFGFDFRFDVGSCLASIWEFTWFLCLFI